MPPSAGRFAERLKALPVEELVLLAAQGCHESAAIRRDADALLSRYSPTPESAVSNVLLSPDLIAHIFDSFSLTNYAVSRVCKDWAVGWSAFVRQRRFIQPSRSLVPSCTHDDVAELASPSGLAALPDGERLAISSQYPHRIRIFDKEMRLLRTLGEKDDPRGGVTFRGTLYGLAAGDDGLYVSEAFPARILRLRTDSFAIAAEHTGEGCYSGFFKLALAPTVQLLFALSERHDYTAELLALDALSLEARFTIASEGSLGSGRLNGVAVCGDELYISSCESRSIRVLSLSGQPRRVICSQPGGWRMPSSLLGSGDRLYLIEAREYGGRHRGVWQEDEEEVRAKRMAGKRLFVLTPEGQTLQVYNSPKPLEEDVRWAGMSRLGGELLVADGTCGEIVALKVC